MRYPLFCAATALALVALGLSSCRPAEPSRREPLTETLHFTTEDGAGLTGTFYPSQSARAAEPGGAPGLILVHTAGADRGSWAGFAAKAQRNGYACLAVDLRGHGESECPENEKPSFRQFDTPDWRACLADIEAARKALLAQGAHPGNLMLIGAGFGANLALVYAVDHLDTQALVMISPGLDYKGIRTDGLAEAYGNRPLLLVTADGDAYSASSSAALKAAAVGFCELRSYPGTAHATDLLDLNPLVTEEILTWLKRFIAEPQ